ncbi:MAG TPA: hypothetical protein VHM31_06230 [Polyangia bacterium]|nr:hypothetical protein [Polyangia bacterium]
MTTASSLGTLDRKPHSDPRAKALMLDALRGRNAKLTRADAVVASGLPEEEAARALTALLREYRSHLSATESGELVYEFDPRFQRRDALTLRERAAAVGARLWKGFTFLFKVAIVTTLVAYFTAFMAMMIAMIVARSNSSDRDDDGGFGFGGLLWFWGWDTGSSGYGRQRARFAPRERREPFYKRVFSFVFGPPAPARDPLADEKQVVAYIRAQRGRIAAVDLVRLMGWTFPRAEQEVTRLMVDYGGEPEVSDDGVVIYTFKELRKTADKTAGGVTDLAPRWASERLETPAPVTGNDAGTNLMIGAFNGFNLLAPFWIVPAFEARLHVSLASWHVALWDFPLAFSALFFAVPAARWIKARRDAARIRARNDRRRLLGRIFAAAGPRPREELAPTPALAAALDRELVELGGDVAAEPDAQGRVLYTFPRIEQETAAVVRARAAAPAIEREAGAIVFSSAD